MKRSRVWSVILACVLVGGLALPAVAGPVTDQLKGAIDRVIKVLDDPALKGEGHALERRLPVTSQRAEFVSLFSDLLERSYISKIELYGGEKIVYANERVEGDQATVATRIVTKNGTEVPIDYRLMKKSDKWLVYDVTIEGVSLVSNYRTQFNKIIQTASYDELVQKLKNKQGELTAEEQPKKVTPVKK